MTLVLLTYLAGVLTIISPCILPVLPFVFARAEGAFVRSTLPLLAGMAITFALVASLAALGGGWAVHANQYGRIAALVVLAVFGLTLLLPQLADALARPFVALGARLTRSADGNGSGSPVSSFVLGIATGLLWAPCAGPILGLVLTGAALNGASASTTLLLLAYAAGAATSLALALLVGGRVFAALKRSLGAGEWIRRALGAAVLASVVAIALGLDTGFLSRLSIAGTTGVEQSLLALARAPNSAKTSDASANATADAANGATLRVADPSTETLPDEGPMPSLDGATEWLNSPPLTAESLRGKVVLVDFWTYSCVNCIRTLPYLRAWYDKYKDRGLVVIGVHAPEFAFEHDVDNIRRAATEFKIDYPIAVDNEYTIWRAFKNEYWPAHYFVDAKGRVRHHHFGEGEYAQSERIIQQLLAEAGSTDVAGGVVQPEVSGAALAAAPMPSLSPETYVGYARAERFASNGGAVHDRKHDYAAPAQLDANAWGLAGAWTIGQEKARLDAPGGRIVYRFHARDLNLVLGPTVVGKPVRFRVRIDGKAPGDDHGIDIDAEGNGTVTQQQLYQLLRVKDDIRDRTFEIEFLDPGVEAFAFTFG
jgi:cytochrome c biogenesis protein CcdA/thiol-disulfide isomerase/thioredoxin